MNSKTILIIIGIIVAGGALYFVQQIKNEKPTVVEQKVAADPKNATYTIEGQEVTLINGKSEKEITPGSASKTITQYFGNDVVGDFNGDSIKDDAFILTQTSGGTGMFFYIAALTSAKNSYKGTNAVLLGDRIAPQTTEFKNGEIIVNYADRNPGEPMVATPTLGVSKHFKISDGILVEIK